MLLFLCQNMTYDNISISLIGFSSLTTRKKLFRDQYLATKWNGCQNRTHDNISISLIGFSSLTTRKKLFRDQYLATKWNGC